ncbi:MAG: hydrogenase iron-sulfur subunit [Acidimicrobiales bacterium]
MRITESLERVSLKAERPVRSAVRSQRFNPLPHAGTISVVLLAVVIVTGLYLTLFYQFGFEASYRAVSRMEDHPIQRVARSIHRFASAGMVLTTVVHAWRIFVASRFSGPRSARWLTGLAALILVWLAGVTGYWLIWDARAQALTEAFNRIATATGAGSAFVVRSIVGPHAGGGSGVMLAIWFAHVGLTVAIGYFTWRHVRRSRLPWLPPRHWSAAMIVALVIAGIALPVGMLDPADFSVAAVDVPLDPFVMFLLPPLLSVSPWWVLAVLVAVLGAAALVPRLFGHDTPVVVIDDAACTGCDLCVIDCPYQALSLVEAEGSRRGSIAVVDAAACVGCGICVGSCSFGAMELPGFQAPETIDPEGHAVVIACQRHVHQSGIDVNETPVVLGALAATGDQPKIVEVPCTGMVHPQAVGALMNHGATGVHIVGCAPGDCAYGIGNVLVDERLQSERAPHVPAKFAGVAKEDFVSPLDLRAAIEHPGAHPSADANDLPSARRGAVAAAVLVGLSVFLVALSTWAPFRSGADEAAVRVVVDHQPGFRLVGQPDPTGVLGADVEIEVLVDGNSVERRTVSMAGDAAVGLIDVSAEPGAHQVSVVLHEGSTTPTVLFEGEATLDAGKRLVIEAVDEPPPPGVDDGRDVFDDNTRGGCGICHSTTPGDDGIGPSLAGIGTQAGDRIAGLDANEYLRQSILDPDAYIVEGYRAGQMLPFYNERLSTDDLDALVLYLESLTGDTGEGE